MNKLKKKDTELFLAIHKEFSDRFKMKAKHFMSLVQKYIEGRLTEMHDLLNNYEIISQDPQAVDRFLMMMSQLNQGLAQQPIFMRVKILKEVLSKGQPRCQWIVKYKILENEDVQLEYELKNNYLETFSRVPENLLSEQPHGEYPIKKSINLYFKRSTTSRENDTNIFGLMMGQKKIEIETFCFIFILDKSYEIHIQANNQKKILLDQKNLSNTLIIVQRTQLEQVSISFRSLRNPAIMNKVYLKQYVKRQKEKRLFLISFTQDRQDLGRLRSDIWSSVKQIIEIYYQENQKEDFVLTYLKELVNYYPQIDKYQKDYRQHKFWKYNNDLFVKDEYYFTLFWFSIYKNTADFTLFKLNNICSLRLEPNKKRYCSKSSSNHEVFVQWKQFKDNIELYRNSSTDIPISKLLDQNSNNLMEFIIILIESNAFQFFIQFSLILRKLEQNPHVSAIQHYILMIRYLEKYLAQYDQKSKMEAIIKCLGSVAAKIAKKSSSQNQTERQHAKTYNLPSNAERLERILLSNDQNTFSSQLNPNLTSILTLYQLYKTILTKSQCIQESFSKIQMTALRLFQSQISNKAFQVMKVLLLQPVQSQQNGLIERYISKNNFKDDLIQQIYLLFNYEIDFGKTFSIIQKIAIKRKSFVHVFKHIIMLNQLKVSPLKLMKITEKIVSLIKIETISQNPNHPTSIPRLLQWSITVEDETCRQLIILKIAQETIKLIGNQRAYEVLCKGLAQSTGFQEQRQRENIYQLLALPLFGEMLNKQIIFKALLSQPRKLISLQKSNQLIFNKLFHEIVEDIMDLQLTQNEMSQLKNNLPQIQSIKLQRYNLSEITNQISETITIFKQKSQKLITLFKQYSCFQAQIKQINFVLETFPEKSLKLSMELPEKIYKVFKEIDKIILFRQTHYWKKSMVITSLQQMLACYQEALGILQRKIDEIEFGDVSISIFRQNFLSCEKIEQLLLLLDIKRQTMAKIQELIHIFEPKSLEMLVRSFQVYLYINQLILPEDEENLFISNTIKKIKDCINQDQRFSVNSQKISLKKQFSVLCRYYSLKTTEDIQQLLQLLNKSKLYQTFDALEKCSDLKKLIDQQKIDHKLMEQLEEYIEDLQSSQISISNLNQFIKVFNFYRSIQSGHQSMKELKSYIQNEQERPYLSACVFSCYFFIGQFKKLIWKAKNREISFKVQIQSMLNHGKLCFGISNNTIKLEIVLGEQDNEKHMSWKELTNYKEKSMLIIKDIKKAENRLSGTEQTLKIFEDFETVYKKIERLLACKQKLSQTGYNPQKLKTQIQIIRGCTDSLDKELMFYEENNRLWQKSTKQIYSQSHLLTYFIGPQVNYLKKAILEGTYLPLYQRVFNIQKKIFQRLVKFDISYNDALQRLQKQPDPIGQIKLLSQVCSNLVQKENFAPQICKLNKLTIIVCSAKYFYSCLLDQDRYANITQVLMCQETTTLMELQCFFYRAFMNSNKRYFIIASHNLNQQTKSAFIDLLLQFHGLKAVQLKSAKITFVTDKTNDNVIALLTKNNLFDYEKKDMTEKICELHTQKMAKFIKPTLIVKSLRAGLGKTFKIQRLAIKNNLKLIYFPVCGNISSQNLSARLQKILDENEEFSLLIQVGHVQNKNILEVFLSQIILFRSFYYQRYIFLPENTHVYIQIENVYCEEQQNSGYHIIKILQEVKQRIFCYSLLDFKQQQIVFDQQNRQDVFVLNYLNMIHTGQISKVDLPFSKEKLLLYPSPQQCGNLVKKYFGDWLRERKSEPTFLIYRNFMNMLFTLFRAFGDSPFFSLSLMEESPEQYKLLKLNEVRSNFLNVCIENTLQFLEESLNTNNFVNHKFESKIRFQEKIKGHKLLIVPSYDLSSYQFVYFDDKNVPFVIKSLLIKENKDLNKRLGRINDPSNVDEIFKKTALNNFKGVDLTQKIFEILSHITGNRDFDPGSQGVNALKEIQTKVCNLHHYKITLDNFFKMCLIILRSLSRVPIIIMGESGVGKTSLIRFLVETVYKQKLIVKNVHAGIHEKQIKIWVEEITEEATLRPQNVWVFFDEFNTSDELSYFKEIIVDRRFMGKTLPQNIIFLAACNPYRQRKANKVNVGLAYVSKHRQTKILAFNVKPPCLSMIQLMWDYEQLKKQELQNYIRNMIRDVDFSRHDQLVTAIVEIHQYFKNQKEISSVSLRDVCRFKELYFWFLIHMPHKQIHHSKRDTKIGQIDPNEIAVILSFCFCYSLGVESRQRRQQILEKTQKRLDFKKGHMTKVLEQIQIDYIKRLSIQKLKVAFNSALMQNLFASLVCLNNRIPILIIGSPGSSKSLSVRMIESSLKGKSSSSQFCQGFPKVNMLYFQGSQSSTSEGVEYLYAKAYEKMKKEKEYNTKNGCENEQQLHCILFDQIGLAQKSIHNPLKVLHSKLQTDQKQLGFIGISNYQLDSAKMSRFLVLAHANPGEKQLKETARKIYEGFYPQQNKYKRQFEQLGEHYSQFIKKWNQNPANITNFFGLRDFYSCLKYICQYISKKDYELKSNFDKIVQKAVTANFDGQNGSLRLFFQIMRRNKEFLPVNPIDLVKQNLSNTQSRCLMLIIKSDALIPIINESIQINGNKIDVVCLYGSTFEQDKESEEYNLQTTSQIITHLSRPVILTFKDINNSIQTSLYDLFNKSFTNRKNSRTCRIAVGANSNPKCQVHPEFNSIIYVQQEMVSKLDLPFINRFQKHQLNLKSMIQPNDLEMLENIMEWIQKVLNVNDSLLVLKRQNYILNCSDEAIVTLIIKLKDSKDMQKDIKTELLRNRTTDFEILMKNNPEIAQINEVKKYSIHVPWTKNQNDLIIFTYDQFPNLEKSTMQELYVINMGDIKNEKILKKQLSKGLKYEKMHIILNYHTEREHLNYLLFKAKQMKHFLESKTQMVIIIKLYRFFFIRNKIDTINISYLHNYDQYFVEDMSSEEHLSIFECKTVWQAFQSFNIRQKIQGLQFDALKLIKLTVQQGQDPNISKEVFHAMSQLPKCGKYRQILLQIMQSCLKQQRMDLQFLHKNKKNAHYSISLVGAVEEYVIEQAKTLIFDLQCTIISEGVVFTGNYIYDSLQQSHRAFLQKMFDGNLEQLLKVVHQQRFLIVLNNFKLKMDSYQHNPRNNAIRQIKNPLFLSLFPQSFLDFSTIFSLKPSSDQTIESIFKEIGLFINNQQKAKMAKASEKQAYILLHRAKFNFADEICPDGHSQRMMEDLYFYDVVMFIISRHTLQIDPPKIVDIFSFFSELFSEFAFQKKIIILAYDTHLMLHIFDLLILLFEKSTIFVQEFKQALIEQSINDYSVRLTQLLIKKSCEVITFSRENMKNHKNSYEFISYFQKMFERLRALQLDYRQINTFSAPLLIYSLNSLIELQFNLKKQNPHFEHLDFFKLLKETQTTGSLFQRICELAKGMLQKGNLDPNCEDLIINYLSLSLFSDWLDSIADYPSEKSLCAEQFKILCNRYSKFANNSSYFLISLFEFLNQQSLEQMRRSLQLKDEDEFEIKKQWIALSDNFSVALGNYFNTLITGCICDRYLKEDSAINSNQLLKDNASILQELCNKREWQPTLQSIYEIELMKKLGQAYKQILISEEDLSTIDRFDDAFSLETQSSSHLRVYLLKMLNQAYSFEEIEQKYIKVQRCKWMIKMKEFIVQQKIQYFLPPQIINEGEMINKQEAFRQKMRNFESSHFENIKLYHEILNGALYENFQPEICYQLLTFFLMKIYNRGIFSKSKSQRLANELRQRQDVNEPRNQLVLRLLLGYIGGQITKEVSYDTESYKQQIMELNYINMLISWRRLRVPMMEMFFKDGHLVHEYGQWLNDRFLLGSIHSPTVQRLQFILRQHKKSMKAKSYSICSATCDYLSPIGGVFYGKDQGCPHPTSQATCPLCNGKLGAETYNKLINEQNGARIIQPERVENEMQRIRSRVHVGIIFRDRKMTLNLKGYHNGVKQIAIEQGIDLRKTLSQSACDHMEQSTSQATHYFQCYLNNLLWYYLTQFGLIQDDQFELIWKESRNTMKRQFIVNLELYRHKLRQQVKLKEDQFIIWNMGIGKYLFQFLQTIDGKYSLKNSQDRDRFQVELQERLCRFYDTEKERLVQQSRNVLQFNKGDIIRQTGDIRRHQNQFKYIRMFKIVKEKPGIQNLGKIYQAKLAKEYKILHQLISKQQVWQKLDDYKTIFAFLSQVQTMFDGNISRRDSQERLEKMVKGKQKNGESLGKFVDAWNRIASNNFELNMDCHSDKVLGCLPSINRQSPLKMFLYDMNTVNNQHAQRLIAFTIIAANEYNLTCRFFGHLLASTYPEFDQRPNFGKIKLNPTCLTNQHLMFGLHRQKLQEIVESYSSQSVQYGISTSHYSFQKIQRLIVRQLVGRRYLESEKQQFKYIHYIGQQVQFITELRNRSEQKTLTELGLKELINKFIQKMAKDKEDMLLEIKVLQAGLEKIVIFFMNMKCTGSDETIEHFMEKSNIEGISQQFKKQVLAKVPLFGLADLYELIEFYSFEAVPQILDSAYSSELFKEEKARIQEIRNAKRPQLPTWDEFKWAMYKFAGRGLCVAMYKEDQRLFDHICSVLDYWPKGIAEEKVGEDLKKLLSPFTLAKVGGILRQVPFKQVKQMKEAKENKQKISLTVKQTKKKKVK